MNDATRAHLRRALEPSWLPYTFIGSALARSWGEAIWTSRDVIPVALIYLPVVFTREEQERFVRRGALDF